MPKKFHLRRLFILMSMMGFSANSFASGFYLWEQDAASIGNYHAGVAAIANDASTNWYNPAGLTRIKNQEFVAGVDPVWTSFQFNGTVDNHTLLTPLGLFLGPQPVSVNGGTPNFVPFLHYVAPINDCVAFGFSADAPFGLTTDYGTHAFSRYAATLTKLQVIDLSPSLAFAVNDKLSFGIGPNWQRLRAELDTVVAAISPATDSSTNNVGYSSAWGYHAGVLYQFNQKTRVGLNYRSRVVHNVTGSSLLNGPLANGFLGGKQRSANFKASATLPATTSFGIFHAFNPCWDILGHISYTQWDVFQNLTLQNVAGLDPILFIPTNALTVNIPEGYSNSWNFSIGANYHPNEKWIFRTGVGYDQTPTSNKFRNLQLPDSDRVGLGIGGHYQINKCVGIDAGYTHIFAANTNINHLTQAFGPEQVTTNGPVKSYANVAGLGIKWDIT